MVERDLSRRRLLGLLTAAVALPGLTACGRAPAAVSGGGVAAADGVVKVGLVVPQSGVYAPLGVDLQRGWDLWLQQNRNKLGPYDVTTVVADEGDNVQRGVPAVQRVLLSDRVDIVVGMVSSTTVLAAARLVVGAKKVLIVANAGAAAITGEARSPYVWRTSFQNAQVAAAAGPYLARQNIPGGVFLIASDYAAGAEARAGFRAAYEAAGGRIVGEAGPAFGTTKDYQPYLTQIKQSGAGAVFCFFAGSEAVSFVRQYAQAGLRDSTPLYGSGFLTEGDVLKAEADAAVGVRTSLFYSDRLENRANRAFVEAYAAAYQATPTCYSVCTWDAAAVLDEALSTASGLDGDAVSAALSQVGPLTDSPRGPWSFDGQSPKQTIYLRTVEGPPGQLSNAITAELGEKSQI